MNLVYQYIKRMSCLQNQAFTFWCQYLFWLSFVFQFLVQESFIISVIVVVAWYSVVLYDYFLTNEPFGCMYRLHPEISKPLLHFFDICIHILPLFISYIRLNKPITTIDVISSWIYSRIWCLIQTNYKNIYLMKFNDSIYNSPSITSWYIFYFIESTILIYFSVK